MGRGAQWATVCEVTENQTQLSDGMHTHTQKRIATEISSRNELPLCSQAQEGLLCKCSQATGSDVGSCHSQSFLSYRRPALHPNPRV